ncbi:MAG TPA: transglutaminase domain-containing protein, partial [Gammaproteobacteria bacterium]|nr:transglutaminase domain-containing protein [Gammaproteobacteria bacterium]
PYIVICLVSATAGESGGAWLFAGLVGVFAYVLFYNRPRTFPIAVWLCVLALAVGVGYLNQIGVLKARRAIEPVVMNFFRDRIISYRNPFRSYTAMGEIGRLKQSDRILLRVEDLDGAGVPTLLHEATYRSFSKNVWLAGNTGSEELISDLEGTTWDIAAVSPENSRAVRISRSLLYGRGMLALPRGTFRIENLPVEELHKHTLGAFRVNRGPGLIRYTAKYAPGRSFELPPGPQDLMMPRDVAPLLAKVTAELDLQDAAPAVALKKLQQFFLTRFEYSLVLRRTAVEATPLHDFLLNTRSGHCEYFATATVLLLRSLGIPARYATGFSVQEYSPLENSFVVRRRHAHSWTLAYLNGGWIVFDTTPPVWGTIEADAASWWEGPYDLLSWLAFKFSRWRWSSDEEEPSTNLLWLIVPLLAVLLWRLVRTQRMSGRLRGERRSLDRRVQPGADSDVYPLLRLLEKRGIARASGEPLGRWLLRLQRRGDADGIDEIVADILPAHYRYRFDPRGISAEERAALKRCVRQWVARFGR